MTTFTLHAVNDRGEAAVLTYDNQTSVLINESTGRSYGMPTFGHAEKVSGVSATNPGRKTQPRVLKVSLGLMCNYECSYCSQRFVPHAAPTNPGDVDAFIAQLTGALTQAPEKIEFWGGEPLVYWKTLKPLAEKLRDLYPDAEFGMVTNGSLLDAEKNAWLDDMGFWIGISHDGPGYHARGKDPMDDPKQREAILGLFKRLHPKRRISLNAVMHKDNLSREAVQSWLTERFGGDVTIGEGAFIDPYDEGGMGSVMKSAAERSAYSRQAFRELRTGAVTNFGIVHDKINDFVKSIRTQRPASALGQKCGMDRADNLAVDLNGNVITCQNVSAAAIAPNGQTHKLGNLSDLGAVEMRSATHWEHRSDCPSCPVLQLCKGSCMFLDGDLWTAGCDAAFADNIPFFAAAIEVLTGYIPVFVEGGRPDRANIWETKELPRRVIPIVAA